MTFHKRFWLIFLITLLLLLAACGGATTPTSQPAQDATEEATDEATTAATLAAGGEATDEATEPAADEATEEATSEAGATEDTLFTSDDGSLSFMVPGSWAVNESGGQITLATSQVELASDDMPAAGEFRAVIFVASVSDMPGLSAGATPVQVLEAVAAVMDNQISETAASGDAPTEEATDEAPLLGEPAEMTIGGRAAARMDITSVMARRR